MYQAQLSFECFQDTTISTAERAILAVIDTLRYSGQIIGREFPTTLDEAAFHTRVICPATDSLHSKYHSPQVKNAMDELAHAGLLRPKVKTLGRDLHSDESDACESPSWQILYTSYIHSCSPLRCGEHFLPRPLYRIPAVANGDQKQIIKWQEDWAACDQLQMNGSIAEHRCLIEISEVDSRLYQRGWDLARRIGHLTQIPTYLYLYRVGGSDLASEQQRLCPSCHKPWRLESPLHDIFDFKCDDCLLVSNLSWDFKD
jgi:predicted  nucleic acid-binding Zn ribbon protein